MAGITPTCKTVRFTTTPTLTKRCTGEENIIYADEPRGLAATYNEREWTPAMVLPHLEVAADHFNDLYNPLYRFRIWREGLSLPAKVEKITDWLIRHNPFTPKITFR